MSTILKVKKLQRQILELITRLNNRQLGDIYEPLVEQYLQIVDDISRRIGNVHIESVESSGKPHIYDPQTRQMVPFVVQVPQPWAQYQYDPAFLEYLENALQWVEPINIWEPLPDTSVNMQELPSLRHSLTHEEKKNNEECAICRMEFEEYEPILRLCPNNHLFHEACITHWINRTGDSRCPYCRQPILIASENLPLNFSY